MMMLGRLAAEAGAGRLAACVLLLVLAATSPSSADECSGNGIRYQEEISIGVLSCACYQCYEGPTCAQLTPNCSLETRVAEATLFQPWFTQHADLDVTITPEYHPGYLKSPRTFPPIGTPFDKSQFDTISLKLNESIRALHAAVGNVDTAPYTLVVGAGGVQLIDAALYALTQGPNAKKAMHVSAKTPYYPHFHMASDLNPLTNWVEDIASACSAHKDALIEVVTSPNNPDNRQMTPACPAAAGRIADYVYRWPHYATANTTARTDDLQIYSLSKLSGYAASRIGWALVRDPAVAATMSQYMWLQSTAAAVESQLRAVKILNAITASIPAADTSPAQSKAAAPVEPFFSFARGALADRWAKLMSLFATTTRFVIEGEQGGLFMWVRCVDQGDKGNCAKPFAAVGITTETGVNYGSGTSHVRICIGHHQSTFDLLTERLQSLFSATQSPLPTPMDDLERAATKVPRDPFRGTDYASMTATLSSHLTKYSAYGVDVRPCDSFSVDELHDVARTLHGRRNFTYQAIYEETRDSRRLAFGPYGGQEAAPASAFDQAIVFERDVASAHEHAYALVRDALCHRIVMQYVHHLSKAKKEALPPMALPALPTRYHDPAEDENALSSVRASSPNSSPVGGVIGAARDIYLNATKCIVCHITNASDPQPTYAPYPGPAPLVPDWPRQFDVKFGLTTKDFTNVSSHMFFSADYPSMHIHHSKCVRDFLPQLPAVDGPCNLTFHGNGLWFTYDLNDVSEKERAGGKKPAADSASEPKIQCCNVVLTDMSQNLGVNELGGFYFVRNETTTDFYGNKVLAEMWSNGERLRPPNGFRIYIDPSTGEDVHYHNGGPYLLEWALDRRHIAPQPDAVFDLPSDRHCEVPCTKAASASEQAKHDAAAIEAARAYTLALRPGL